MAREFSVVVGINATKAQIGARQFKTAAGVVNRSNTKMQTSTARTTRKMTAMITTMGRFRGVASLMFAGFLGVGGIASVVRTISQFQTAMSSVNAIMGSRGTTGIMAALTEKARDLGAATLFTATQAAEGMKFLTLAGFDALEVYQAIGPALNLATAGMLGLGEAADIVSNVMSAFAIDASETERVVDALAFVSARTNTDIRQLGQAMKFVGPIAGTLGIDVTQTAIALGVLGNSGLQASLAGTSLRRVMSGLLNPAKTANTALAAMGLTSEEWVGNMTDPEQGLIEVIRKLEAVGLSAGDAFLLFGQRGAPGVLSLVTQLEKLDALALDQELGKISGEAARMARIMQDNLGGDARIAISSLQEAILQLGDAGLADFLRSATQGFTGFIRGLTGVVTAQEDLTEAMSKGVAIGQLLSDHSRKIKIVFLGLSLVLFRNLIPALVRSIFLMGVWAIETLPKLISRLVASAAATGALGIGLRALTGALLATGIGAFVVLLGLLAEYVLFSLQADETTEDLGDQMVSLASKVEQLAFAFHTLTKEEQNLNRAQTARVLRDQVEVYDQLEESINSYAEITKIAEQTEAQFQATLEHGAQGRLNIETQNRKNEKAVRAWREEQNEAIITLENFDNALAVLKLAKLNGDMDKTIQTLEYMQEVVGGFHGTFQDWKDSLDGVGDSLETTTSRLEKALGLTLAEAQALTELSEAANPAATAIAELAAEGALLKKAWAALRNPQVDQIFTLRELTRMQDLYNFKLKEAGEELNDVEKAAKKQAEAYKKLAESLDPLVKFTNAFRAGLAIAQAELESNRISTEEYIATVLKLRDAFQESSKEFAEQCDKVDDLTKCMDENAKAMDVLWDQALRNIQDAFADAFRGAFDSASSFFDKILDAFKDMISQMLAQWAISGIANLFSGNSFSANGNGFGNLITSGINALSGGGAAGSSGTGTGTGTGVLSSTGALGSQLYGEGTALGDALSTFAGGVTSFFQGAGALVGVGESAALVSGTGAFGVGASGQAIANVGGSAASVGGSAVAGAGIGAITGLIADAILGGRGDPIRGAIFAAIGGAIGSFYFGPIGAAIGGAIGSLVDNIFGGAEKLEKAVLELDFQGRNLVGTQTEVVSKQKSFFRGKKYTETVRDVSFTLGGLEQRFIAFADAIQAGGDALGGDSGGFLDDFSKTLTINIKNLNSSQIQAALTGFLKSAMLDAIDAFLDNVTGLEADVHAVLSSFSNSIEAFATAMDLLISLQNLFDVNLLETVSDAFTDANKGVIDSYQESLEGFRGVIEAYDGSLEALQLLTQATAVFTTVQLELISIYEQVGASISSLFQGSAQTVREALLSEEELYNLRRSQIDDLVEQASMTTDPEELSRLAEEINRLGLDAFNLLDEDQQSELGQEFIEFFEGLDELFGDQIETGISDVVQDQVDLDIEVSNRLLEAAQAIIEAAELAARLAQEAADRQRRENERDYR
jgi:TP901 family phage tail tape measure protein